MRAYHAFLETVLTPIYKNCCRLTLSPSLFGQLILLGKEGNDDRMNRQGVLTVGEASLP